MLNKQQKTIYMHDYNVTEQTMAHDANKKFSCMLLTLNRQYNRVLPSSMNVTDPTVQSLAVSSGIVKENKLAENFGASLGPVTIIFTTPINTSIPSSNVNYVMEIIIHALFLTGTP